MRQKQTYNKKTKQEDSPLTLPPWTEATGRLKKIDKEEGTAVLEIQKKIRVSMTPERLSSLSDKQGEKLSILRTDRFDEKEYLVDVKNQGDTGD